MDTVLANYVDRECAPLEEIYKSMYAAEGNLCFLGPKWAGKTTTLIAAYRYCLDKGMQCKYMDLAESLDSSNMTDRTYFFVDNAQLLNSKGECISLLRKRALVICFAYSCNINTSNGNSLVNSRIQVLGRRFFLRLSRHQK